MEPHVWLIDTTVVLLPEGGHTRKNVNICVKIQCSKKGKTSIIRYLEAWVGPLLACSVIKYEPGLKKASFISEKSLVTCCSV